MTIVNFNLRDAVQFKQHPGAHWQTGRVVGRSYGKGIYDIRDESEKLFLEIPEAQMELKTDER